MKLVARFMRSTAPVEKQRQVPALLRALINLKRPYPHSDPARNKGAVNESLVDTL